MAPLARGVSGHAGTRGHGLVVPGREWRDAHPDDLVINREIGVEPLPATAWAAAVTAASTSDEQRSPEQRDAVALAATLTDELRALSARQFA